MTLNIGYLVGSLSTGSINRTLVRTIVRNAGEELAFTEISIGELPLYNRDYDADYPAPAQRFKDAVLESDGLLFITPEYNRTIPAVLKNALEWGSRPFGQNAFTDIPAGVIGASPGRAGTSMSQQHLRNVLSYLNVPTMGQPEAYLHVTDGMFGPDGTVHDETTREFLTMWIASFTDWVRRLHGA